MAIELLRLKGAEARSYVDDLADLRLKIFSDFPYLYEGSLDYEKKYLETYFKAKHSFILMVLDQGVPVGATTGIWAHEEEDSFRRPFERHGLNPKKVFYFGESVLAPEYRGQGLGKVFFEEREKYARSLEMIDWLSFASVVRPDEHLLRPKDYRPLDEFWKSQGFHKEEGLTTVYEWQDKDQPKPSEKVMQYWLKQI